MYSSFEPDSVFVSGGGCLKWAYLGRSDARLMVCWAAPHIWSQAVISFPSKVGLFALLLSLIGIWVQGKNAIYPYNATPYFDEYSVRSPNLAALSRYADARNHFCEPLASHRLNFKVSKFHLTRPLIHNTMIDVSALSILPGYHTPSPQTRCGQWGEMTTLYILHFILFLGTNLFLAKI
mgnify:CR=1 FL=1